MANIIEDLNWRYACKEFDSTKKLSEEQVDTLMESLRLSASSYGLQPWSFLRVVNPELREKLVEHSYGQEKVKEASDLIILCAKTDLQESDIDEYIADIAQTRNVEVDSLADFKKMLMYPVKWEDKRKNNWMAKQVYIALGNLLTVCATMRIDACPMEGFVPSKVNELLGLKEMGLKAIVFCPVGYRAKSDDYAEAKKVRFDKERVIKTIV